MRDLSRDFVVVGRLGYCKEIVIKLGKGTSFAPSTALAEPAPKVLQPGRPAVLGQPNKKQHRRQYVNVITVSGILRFLTKCRRGVNPNLYIWLLVIWKDEKRRDQVYQALHGSRFKMEITISIADVKKFKEV